LKRILLLSAAATSLLGQGIVPISPPKDFTVILPSSPTPQSALVQFADTIFPHMTIGGGWDTTMVIVNLTAQTIHYRQYFFDQSGQPLQVTFRSIPQGVLTTTSALMGTLPPDQSFNFQLLDLGQPLQVGWSALAHDTPNTLLGGFAIFHLSYAHEECFPAPPALG
jgi:hypothetical protein